MFCLKLRNNVRGLAVHEFRRFLNLHEYQSKGLLAKFGLSVQRGKVASTAEEAERVARELLESGSSELVLKSQILAGGRGQGVLSSGLRGGVKICRTASEVQDLSSQMLGYRLRTKQTGEEGELVQRVLVHDSVNIVKEFYLAFALDRSHGGLVMIASSEGGMDIEEVAKKFPSKIVMEPVSLTEGVKPEMVEKVAAVLGLSTPSLKTQLSNHLLGLFNLFLATDSTLIEINPLALTDSERLMCIDAKLSFDDNAQFRQSELFDQEDVSARDPSELEAAQWGLSFVALDGSVGCVVNGAGLAMATLDLLSLKGAKAANFLDVGGSANAQQVEKSLRIILRDPKVKVIFVNILGGIMRCDVIAQGIIDARRSLGELRVPMVIRLEGTNAQLGRDLLAQQGIQCLSDLDEAAQLVADIDAGVVANHQIAQA